MDMKHGSKQLLVNTYKKENTVNKTMVNNLAIEND